MHDGNQQKKNMLLTFLLKAFSFDSSNSFFISHKNSIRNSEENCVENGTQNINIFWILNICIFLKFYFNFFRFLQFILVVLKVGNLRKNWIL